MLPVAFAPHLWAATLRTLRELTRLAVTALVLVVGLGGTTAGPAFAELPRPVGESGRPAAFWVSPASVALASADQRPGSAAERVTVALSGVTAAERVTGTPSGRPAGARSESVRCTSATRPVAAAGPACADPGRDAVGRRGPPRI
ncbi:hypothetical protein [Micromonospora sp. RTP1Z1]|uniref:hypothetical protein n=1 Tax=Micromonospora sp. RTP1Z1 TaxID=2994043 RepID=UPI0029C6C6EF|nr:hypothetical protein [Micromonospora sp. RTP1Z1]